MVKFEKTTSVEEFEEIKNSLLQVVEFWIKKHPGYTYNAQYEHTGNNISIVIMCNDITSINSRLN